MQVPQTLRLHEAQHEQLEDLLQRSDILPVLILPAEYPSSFGQSRTKEKSRGGSTEVTDDGEEGRVGTVTSSSFEKLNSMTVGCLCLRLFVGRTNSPVRPTNSRTSLEVCTSLSTARSASRNMACTEISRFFFLSRVTMVWVDSGGEVSVIVDERINELNSRKVKSDE